MRWREQPGLDILHQLLLAFSLLDFGEPVKIGVRQQFRRQGTIGAQEQDGSFLEAGRTPGCHQARPPIMAGKILAG